MTGVKVFDSWEQVSLLWEFDVSPLLLVGHPHMPRYMVAYPGFLLEERWPGVGFSAYISFFCAINFALFYEISKLAIRKPPSAILFIVFISAHLFMNGRGVIAWAGWLLCIWISLRTSTNSARHRQLFLIAPSCLLASVSTGVFIVVFIAFSVVLLRCWRAVMGARTRAQLVALAFGLSIAYTALDFFLLSIAKNVDFYGGGISGVIEMLSHGLGVYFFQANIIVIIIFALIIYALLFLLFLNLYNRKKISIIDYFIGISLLGGFFGFTVLTLVIPLILLRLQSLFQRGQRMAV